MTSKHIAENKDTNHDTLSSWKKWTSWLIIKIQNELTGSQIWDICTYDKNRGIAPSFQAWKMKYNKESEILLALANKSDREAIFFRMHLSVETLRDLDNFKSRLLDLVS